MASAAGMAAVAAKSSALPSRLCVLRRSAAKSSALPSRLCVLRRSPAFSAPATLSSLASPVLARISASGISRRSPTRRLRESSPELAAAEGVIPARDVVVDFGKFEGAMLGTLKSAYLGWMVRTLSTGPRAEWGRLAQEVLRDPFYADRLEWERVERLMASRGAGVPREVEAAAALAPAEALGWDMRNEAAWRRVNFSLLGTTRGGRIPRVKTGGGVDRGKQGGTFPRSAKLDCSPPAPSRSSFSPPSGDLREELMRRRARRQRRLMSTTTGRSAAPEAREEGDAPHAGINKSKFVGRQALLRAVRGHGSPD